MLIQRVITAVVLLVVLLAAVVFAKPWGLILLTLLFVGVGIGEWLTLLGLSRRAAVAIAVAATALLWLTNLQMLAHPQWLMGLLRLDVLIWLGLGLCLIFTGGFPLGRKTRLAWIACAIALPSICALALLAAYRTGLMFLLSILILVWVADIAAYFFGKAFGRHKLAPVISPGKTVEGALGGLLAVWVVGGASMLAPSLSGSLFARLGRSWSGPGLVFALALLVGFSILGDLLESSLKRQAGAKDSSHLLPGHGGILDRIDALLPVIPVALLMSHGW
jgi:phosphatidate cytidylyltransferase